MTARRQKTSDLGLWPTDLALELLHGPRRCRLCSGHGWVEYVDPLYRNRTYSARCPDCADRADGLR